MNELIKQALENPTDPVPDPIPLEGRRHPVLPLTAEMLPKPLWDYVHDVSHRAQCPPDFVAVGSLCAISGLIGRKRVLKPKANDDWQLVPNLWGAAVGGPSAMKSPSLKAALAPLQVIEREAIESSGMENARQSFLAELKSNTAKANKKIAQEKFEEGDIEGALALMESDEDQYQPVPLPRYIVNDATVEKLGEILSENPNGVLMYRDELSGLIAKLSSEDYQQDRAFYLECYDGNGSHTSDRIVRGTTRIETCVLALLGGIQPAKLAKTLTSAVSGHGDDGFIQRFQLAVYPEPTKGKKWRDVAPSPAISAAYRSLFDKALGLTITDEAERFLRFDDSAQRAFASWWEELQELIESHDTAPVIQSHYGKMPKTIGALAAIFHICESSGNQINKETLDKALLWWPYLKSHADRIYGIVDDQNLANAKKLLHKRKDLEDGFTVRNIRRKNWAGLKDNEQITSAIELLTDHNFLFEVLPQPNQPGRPTVNYNWNAKLDKRAK